MSGFVGIAGGAPIDPALLRSLSDAVAYRGTEPAAVWSSGPVGFGYSHLATNQNGESPEQPATLDGRTFLVGHLLLCARNELIARLVRSGTALTATTSDAVLVLHAYRLWGARCLDHMIGEFAFAIWDDDRQSLLCVRDHFGVRPLYYAAVGDGIVFSNSVAVILLHPGVSREIDETAVGDFLLGGWNLEHTRTSFAQVRRLPPGNLLEWQPGAVTVRPYYTVPLDGHIRYRKNSDYVENLRELLDKATADRLPTAGPVSIRFSGGMDSTSVAASVRQVAPHIGLKGFTLFYERVMPSDREREFAQAAATHLEMPLELINFDDVPLLGSEAPVDPDLQDESFLDGNLDLNRRMGVHGRVALSGDTGDHVFLPPYGFFRDRLRSGQLTTFAAAATSYVRRFRSPPPLGISTTLRRLRHGPDVYKPERWINQEFATRMQLEGRWERATTAAIPHPLRPYAHRVITGPLQSLLFQRDDARMAPNKIESRHVFADVRLVEYLLAIPGTPWMFHKLILREATRGRLPEVVRTRPKTALPEYCVAAIMRDRGADLSVVTHTPGIGRFINVNAHPTKVPAGMPYAFYTPTLNTGGVSLARWLQRTGGS